MAQITHQLVDIVRQDPDVSGVFSFTGASSYNPTENTARVFIQLKPHAERDLTSAQIIRRLRPKVAAVQGARFFMQSGQDISIGGRLSRTLYQYTLTDTDSDELNHWAPMRRGGDEEAAAARGRRLRPAGRRAASGDRDRPRRGLAARHLDRR